MELRDLGREQFVSLETFKRDGSGVKTPVWITQADGKLYVLTDSETWKVKRIRRNPRVRLAASDARGAVSGAWAEGTARILDNADAIAAQHARGRRKYGLLYRAFTLLGRLRRRQYLVIEIT